MQETHFPRDGPLQLYSNITLHRRKRGTKKGTLVHDSIILQSSRSIFRWKIIAALT